MNIGSRNPQSRGSSDRFSDTEHPKELVLLMGWSEQSQLYSNRPHRQQSLCSDKGAIYCIKHPPSWIDFCCFGLKRLSFFGEDFQFHFLCPQDQVSKHFFRYFETGLVHIFHTPQHCQSCTTSTSLESQTAHPLEPHQSALPQVRSLVEEVNHTWIFS